MSVHKTRRSLFELLEPRIALSGFSRGNHLPQFETRTIDGAGNNIASPLRGSADIQQIRFGYGDDFPDDNGDQLVVRLDPAGNPTNARELSNALFDQAASVLNERLLTDWIFQWGQWVTHDMDITRNGPQFGTAHITNPDDPDGLTFIPFNRSEFADGTGENGVRRDVVNEVTSYIDASLVYGSDPARALALRTLSGGRLKTSANGKLLPVNSTGLDNDNGPPGTVANQLFLAGDIRANEQLGLTAVHTLFVREHNRLAGRIQQLFPRLSDEQIYQTARRLVGAEIQKITYDEFLPALLGHDLAPNDDAAVYNSNVEADVTNAFAHAVFRFGHTQISEELLLVNNSGRTVDSLSIDEAFFDPAFLKANPDRVGLILKGLASQVGQEMDLLLTDGIRNNLFGPPGAGGLDLGALDIQRARDHGLPDYAQMLVQFRVVPAGTTFDSFDDLAPFISQENRDQLAAVYATANDIDLFVGVLAETHLTNSSMGALGTAIISNQFARLRDGDRFFYTDDAFLQSSAVERILNIDKVTLASVIKANTGIANIQDNVFFDKSVLIVEAPQNGATMNVTTAGNNLVVTNNGRTTVRSLSSLQQVILVGSDFARDTFNVEIAGANGRLEKGIVIYAGLTTQVVDPPSPAVNNSPGDTLNVFGRLFRRDTFTVTSEGTIDTASVTTLRRTATLSGVPTPAENRLLLDTPGRTILVNGNLIVSTGIEMLRVKSDRQDLVSNGV